ncbi:Ig domain-containing protein [Conexibacter sp. JD483]|uniref:Ig domain-containing protein n=1 Tax=unclassified Conexibacter TaxID=2627773 RepID=UPI00271A9392|nr:MULTISPECIES: Ig domain-containing protein [unclassified Conexibacter]MDO8184975.1 Ig domain-containing protein [Conexibacter sp. CPCC 205706]MDO8198119.1 Ig domain-containing protein [Conexibacter sp. CPCC 205762]MDR9368259.1 Ig domain-containing protein [Conexibacter sp. JD483]
MTGQGRLSTPRTARIALLLFVALLAWCAQRVPAATAAPTAPPVCAPADCPAAGAPQVITLGSPAGAAKRGAKARPSRLVVKLSGGTSARRAYVVSPSGRRWRIARSRTFKPKVFGRWTVTGNRIAGTSTVTFPQYRSTIVKVRKGGRGTAHVRWVQRVSNTTRVAQPSAITSSVKTNGTYTVTLDDPNKRVAVGDTLAAGPGKATPQGLLIVVASVNRSGDSATVTGTQAPLSAIGPQARIRVEPQLQVGPGKLGAKSSVAQQPEGGVDKPYRCSGGVDASIKGSLGLSAGAEIGISWGGLWHPLTIEAIAVARLQQSSQLALRVSGKAKCELDVDLLSRPIRYSPITFSVGPVPVVITPKLNFHVIAEGSVEGAVSTSVRQAMDARVGLQWDGKKLIPVKSLDNDFRFTPPEPEFNAGIMAGIGPKLMFDVYEVGGPYLTAEALIRFDVDSTRDPWWRLSGGFQAGAGIAFQVWRFSFDRNVPDLFSKDWTIAKASGSAPPQVSTSTLPDAVATRAYSQTLAAIGGTRPFTWSVTKGSLPAGLTLNPSSGQISGTPTSAGVSAFTVTVTDSKRKTATRDLRIAVATPPAAITTASLPNATAGKPYTTALAGSGSSAPYRWAISAGNLPAGVTLDGQTGTISGIPSSVGTGSFTVELTGADGQKASRALSIAVDAAALSVPAQTLPAATVESAYRATLNADGGVAPLTWAITAGRLPEGLTLSADGVVSGSATAPGESGFTVTVTDAVGTRATRELTIRSAYPAFSLGTQSLLSPMAGQSYRAQLRATGGGSPITWAVTGGTLPAGLSLATDGAISGTATTEGDAIFTVEATDKFGQRATLEIRLTVVPNALEVLSSAFGGRVGTAFAETLEVRGGRAPFTWTVASGSLPAGLTLDRATGAIGGTPTASGSRSVTFQVSDADSVVARGTVTFTIAGNTAQYLRSVSCAGDSCTALDNRGGVVTYDATSTRWGDRIQLPAWTTTDGVIGCAADGSCLVVDNAGKAYTRVDGTWSVGPTVTDGLSMYYGKMVSCVRADFCMFAGKSSANRAAIWTWNGSAWSIRTFPAGEGSDNQMTSVQCVTATNCVAAVGSRQSITRWNGVNWTAEESLTSRISYVQQVACTPGGRCVAGGTFGDYTLFDGSSWSAGRAAGGRPAYPISCAPTGSFCMFAGLESSANIYTWTGSGSPSAAYQPASGLAFAGSCASSTLCASIGDRRAVRWNGTAWVEDGEISFA